MDKVQELRQKSDDQLNNEVDLLKAELFTLRFQQATGELENPAQIRKVRKQIARIKTILHERVLGK